MSGDVFWQRDGLRASYAPSFPHRARLEERLPSGRWRIVGPLYTATVDEYVEDLHDRGLLETECVDYWFDVWGCGPLDRPTPVGCRGSVRFNRDRQSNRRANKDGEIVSVSSPGWTRDPETGIATCPGCRRAGRSS